MAPEEFVSLGEPLSIGDFYRSSQFPETITLTDGTKMRIRKCREVLDHINSDEKPVYGVSTGFGHLENKWIPTEKQAQLQLNLIRSHAIGTGQIVPSLITQRAMILLANSLAKGHSGIELATVERIILYIQKGIIPVSYSIGSLGASGDLAPLAHVALSLIGEGEVEFNGVIQRTEDILKKIGIEPLHLKAKEGLALINGTHFITAYGLTLLEEGRNTLMHSMLAASMSIEALRATDTPFDERIADVRGHPGHIIISKLMRNMLEGSQIIASHKDPLIDHKTQDAYAIRCIPQVLGAIWDCFSYLERTLSIELNAVTDNPLVFPKTETILSGGNFHAEPLGFPIETVSMALIELANITEARIARLVSPFTPELPAFLANSPGLESGYMIAHYTVAALVNKLRGLGHPNIIDNIPVSGNQEDHVSMAMNSAVRSKEILDLSFECVIFEIMMAYRGLKLVENPPSSEIINKVVAYFDGLGVFQEDDHIIHDILQIFKKEIEENRIMQILEDSLDLPLNFN
ncbi:MAG: HAL/PAL/TAL family ammonia-lyase [Candidatus Kariarchaeaceae archaeon]|jgi:histidine ammonia-lyase